MDFSYHPGGKISILAIHSYASMILDISLNPFQIEKSQAEIYRLRAKLESTQTENENYQDELEKLQSVVNKSYSDKDRFVSDLDKLREELERSQVRTLHHFRRHPKNAPCIQDVL